MRRCPKCKKKISSLSSKCPYCGHKCVNSFDKKMIFVVMCVGLLVVAAVTIKY